VAIAWYRRRIHEYLGLGCRARARLAAASDRREERLKWTTGFGARDRNVFADDATALAELRDVLGIRAQEQRSDGSG